MVPSFLKRKKNLPEEVAPSPSCDLERKKVKKTSSKSKGKKTKDAKKSSSKCTNVAVTTKICYGQGGGINYGYGDAAPDTNKYGYGDAAPDTDKYGYGDAAPDTDKYGYGDAAPDTDKYGYGDAAPDTDKYGYGEAAPDTDKYGYGEGAPDDHRPTSSRTPRRSSMKTSESRTQRRRQSIGFSGEKEVRLPGNQRVKRRTSISFDEQVKVRQVEKVSDLTEEPEKLWFQDDEYSRMREKSFKLVEMVEKHGMEAFKGGKVPCIRGLERYIGNARTKSSENKENCWDAVLWEQHYQREDGDKFDDEKMALSCMKNSERSKIEAAQRAAMDQQEIEQYTKSTRRACRRFSC